MPWAGYIGVRDHGDPALRTPRFVAGDEAIVTPARTLDDSPQPAEIADVGLATSPLAMVFFALAWAGIGAQIAVSEARRGHELRHLFPLGIALGPFLAGYARTSLRRLEDSARPVVVREPAETGRGPGLLIALVGSARHVADVLPMLARLTSPGTAVDVVRPVTFDAARCDEESRERGAATRDLEHAGLFLHELDPGLLLAPGPGLDAFRRLAADRDAEYLVVGVADPETDRGRVEILTAGPRRQVDHR